MIENSWYYCLHQYTIDQSHQPINSITEAYSVFPV